MPAITHVKPSALLDGESRHIQGIDVDIDQIKLRGEDFTAKVTDQIAGEGIRINRTIEGASTLTIPMSDDEGRLRRHPLFQERFDVDLDGLKFTFVAKEKPDSASFQVTMEARNVWRLRQHSGDDHGGAAKAYRDKVTRAEFWVGLAKTLRPEIPIWCPELHTPQPIESVAKARDDEVERDIKRGKGLDTGAKLTVKGVKANASQIRLADTMMRAAVSYGADNEVCIALIAAEIVESTMLNLTYGDSSSVGILQLLDIHGPVSMRRDVAKVVTLFLRQGFTGRGGAIELAKRGMSPAAIAQAVQGAANPVYGQYVDEAAKWVDAFQGGSLKGGVRTITETKRYPFTIPAQENWWTAGQRLFSEVNWRLFESAGLIYVIAETDLLESRVRMRCHEGAPGIDEITWATDTGTRVDEVSVVGRARDWAAPPGSVAEVEGEGDSVDGRYIVAEIESFLATSDVTVTLKRPSKPLPEPAPETTTRTIGGGDSGSFSVADGPEAFQKMVAEAERIDKLNLTYVFGGGHVAGMAPPNGPFDCSSAVSRILQVGGFLNTTLSTGPLNTWGEPGKGKLVTVYVRNGGAGGGHTIIKLGDRFWGTSSENPGGGPGFISPTSSYVATLPVHRHPKGL